VEEPDSSLVKDEVDEGNAVVSTSTDDTRVDPVAGGQTMIVQLVGLPGTGKSSLAAELVHRLDGSALLLDKDRVRHALFGPRHTIYTREQDDFCVIIMFRTAAWHLRHTPSSVVIFDGRTYSRAYQVTQVRRFAARARQPLRLIECICADTIIEQRLGADITRSRHLATNRDIDLYRRLKASADPIPEPKLCLDTAKPLPECADRALAYLRHPLRTDPDPVRTITGHPQHGAPC
jgi:predicted kinase